MIHWIAIGVLILLGFMLLKFDHHGRKIKLVIVLVVAALIYLSIISIFNSESFDLSSPKGIVKATYLYFGWLGRTAANLWDAGKETAGMVGNAIKFNSTEES